MSPSVAPLSPPDSFLAGTREHSIELDAEEKRRIGLFLALLLDANTRTNLTAIRDPEEAWTRHALDALSLLAVLAEIPAGGTVLDVGSGGGVPGLVLAIARPELRYTLLDATAKKCEFMREAASAIGLSNVSVVQGRAEPLGHDRGERVNEGGTSRREGGMRESFDLVTARALGRIAVASELTIPFAKVGGLVVLVKGAKADEELEEAKGALHLLHASHAATILTPTGRLVVLEKRRTTPKNYPRRDGEPKRTPLGVQRARVE